MTTSTLSTFETMCFIVVAASFLSAVLVALYKWIEEGNIGIIFCEIKNAFLGDKYFVRINGVWSVYRGKRRRGSEILLVKYGPDKHLWKLMPADWDMVDDNWKHERVEKEVVDRNILELKRLHPKKKENMGDDDWAYEPRYYTGNIETPE